MTGPTDADGLTMLAEKTTGEFTRRFLTSTPPDVQAEFGVTSADVAGGIVMAMRRDNTGFWSKALGFGFDRPVDETVVEQVVAFFRDAGVPTATLSLASSVVPAGWLSIAARHGLVEVSRTAKLGLRASAARPSEQRTDLTVRLLVQTEAPAWSALLLELFGLDVEPLLAAALVDPTVRVFGAFDGDVLVSAAVVSLVDEAAALHTGATLPAYRGRGAQTALIAIRVRAALDAGASWLFADTDAPSESGPGASFRNLSRAGFVHLHDRVDWRWSRNE